MEIKVINGNLLVEPRKYTTCSVVNNVIYCYGGYKNGSVTAGDHLSLNLSILDQSFTYFDELKWEWHLLPNTTYNPNDNQSKPIYADIPTSIPHPNENSYFLLYFNHLLKYDIDQHIWINLSSGPFPSPRITYVMGSMIALKENSSIWLLGVENYDKNNYGTMLYMVNYNTLWTQRIKHNYQLRTRNTATLASNGIIYIIGGYAFKPFNEESEAYYNNFTNIILFDTKSSTWFDQTAKIKPNHFVPSNRMHHTTNETTTVTDTYFIYDYKNNILETVKPTPGFEIYTLFAHCATIYMDKYLVLLFGNTNKNYPAKDLIKIVNITDPYNPKWIRNNTIHQPTSSSSSIPTSNFYDYNKELNQTLKTVIITSSIIGVLILIFTVFYILKNKREKRKARFIIEQGHCFEILDYQRLKGEYQYHNNQESDTELTKPFDKSPQDNFIEYGKLYDQQPKDHFCKPNKNQA
ncbi:unnamed protein product [Cunninghamella blakesleeana]